ncbi:dihydropteroate synthase [bacterium]|nr:dihydropteroate synthase [bacterium]
MQFKLKTISKKFIKEEIASVGFDKSYLDCALNKHKFLSIKIFELDTRQATILKQTALSSDCDCALNRGVLDNSVEFSDVILSGTINQLNDVCQKLTKQPFNMKKLSNDILDLIEKTSFEPKTPKIMGILNITDDSFSDAGEFLQIEKSLNHAIDMIEQGAKIIDIGAQATNPNAQMISPSLETERLTPIVIALKRAYPNIEISIDTFNFETAKTALDLGCDIINDVSFLKNIEFLKLIKLYDKKLVIMHSKGDNKTMDELCDYENLIEDIYFDLKYKINVANSYGLNENNLILDVGFGFAKTITQNIELMKRIKEFKTLGYPLLCGVSRKRFMQDIINTKEAKDADFISALSAFYLMENSVDIIRAHNVELTKQALQLHCALL